MRRLLHPAILLLAAMALAACGAEETGTPDTDAGAAAEEAQTLAEQVRDSAQRLADAASERVAGLDPDARAELETRVGEVEQEADSLAEQARELPDEAARDDLEAAADELRTGAEDLRGTLEEGGAGPDDAVRDNLDAVRDRLTAALDQIEGDVPSDARERLTELREEIAGLSVDGLSDGAPDLDTPEGIAQELEAVTGELVATIEDLPADPGAALEQSRERIDELEQRARAAAQAAEGLSAETAGRDELMAAAEAAEQAVASARDRLENGSATSPEDIRPQVTTARDRLEAAVRDLETGVTPERQEQLDDVRRRLEQELGDLP